MSSGKREAYNRAGAVLVLWFAHVPRCRAAPPLSPERQTPLSPGQPAGRDTGPQHGQGHRSRRVRNGNPASVTIGRPLFGQTATQEACFVALVVVVIGPDNGEVIPIRFPPQIGPPLPNEHPADAAHQIAGFSSVPLEDGR